MYYVCLLRDTRKRQNAIQVVSALKPLERRLVREKKERKRRKIGGELLLAYYECLPNRAQALERRRFLESGEGLRTVRRWLQRWDRAETVE